MDKAPKYHEDYDDHGKHKIAGSTLIACTQPEPFSFMYPKGSPRFIVAQVKAAKVKAATAFLRNGAVEGGANAKAKELIASLGPNMRFAAKAGGVFFTTAAYSGALTVDKLETALDACIELTAS